MPYKTVYVYISMKWDNMVCQGITQVTQTKFTCNESIFQYEADQTNNVAALSELESSSISTLDTV